MKKARSQTKKKTLCYFHRSFGAVYALESLSMKTWSGKDEEEVSYSGRALEQYGNFRLRDQIKSRKDVVSRSVCKRKQKEITGTSWLRFESHAW